MSMTADNHRFGPKEGGPPERGPAAQVGPMRAQLSSLGGSYDRTGPGLPALPETAGGSAECNGGEVPQVHEARRPYSGTRPDERSTAGEKRQEAKNTTRNASTRAGLGGTGAKAGREKLSRHRAAKSARNSTRQDRPQRSRARA
jgi:hypothetical protein